MPEQIPLIDLVAQYKSIQMEINAAIQRVLDSGHFILGPEVSALESEVAAYLGVKYGVGVASGTDALILALRAFDIGPGDEVIVPAYTFFATAGAVLHVGAKPVFVDIEPRTYCIDPQLIEAAITTRTKAILPVHLYGHPADMEPILAIARQHGLKVIEDNAQAFGAEYNGRKTGSFGEAACLSFFPTKNLGAYGDGGMVVTDDEALAGRIKMLRTHGWKKKYFPEELGYNSRLDALQAAVLRIKLPCVDDWNERRRDLAGKYQAELSGLPIDLPLEKPGSRHVFHLYILRVQQRERLRAALKEAGIATDVYYPQPPYLAEPCSPFGYQAGLFPVADRAAQDTLALPLFPEMKVEQQLAIIDNIQVRFQGKNL